MSDILLHTIAIEPARWTPKRVSCNLVERIPAIAAAGFEKLEIYEPHLTFAPDRRALKAVMEEHGLEPVILSSYLQLNPHWSDDNAFAKEAAALLDHVREFGFRKVRLFAGPGVKASDSVTVTEVGERIGRIANMLPETQILIETHDGSIADSPQAIVDLVERLALENVALLWQPTVFDDASAWRQWTIQRRHVRHIHLQNRQTIAEHFALLGEGTVRWPRILREAKCSASIEFVPSGICTVEEFDFATTIEECVREAKWAETAMA